jgi:hypothetical protein
MCRLPVRAVPFLVLFSWSGAVASLAHSAWVATIKGHWGRPASSFYRVPSFKVRLAFARNVPVAGSVRRLLNQARQGTRTAPLLAALYRVR